MVAWAQAQRKEVVARQAVGVAHHSVSAAPTSAAQPHRRSQDQRQYRRQHFPQTRLYQVPRLVAHLSAAALRFAKTWA